MATLSVLNYNSSPRSTLTKLTTTSSIENMSGVAAADVGSGNGNGTSNISITSITAVTGSGRENKTFSKLTVHNIFNENNGNTINITNNNNKSGSIIGSGINNVNTIVRKIKDFGICGAVNNVTRKSINLSGSGHTAIARKRPLTEAKPKAEQKTPQATSKKANKIIKDTTNAPRVVKKSSDAINRIKLQALNVGVVQKPPGTPGRKGLPLPQAVARRNARERNRVKQVNNGFAALRERIPEEVAESFEAHSNGRGSVKKLSKVETLRMAVEYIRSLERLLGFNFPIGGNDNELASVYGEDSFAFIKDEFDDLSPSMDENFDDSLSNYDIDEFVTAPSRHDCVVPSQGLTQPNSPRMIEFDMLPNITTLNGLQYIRIPGTNTYQLLTPDIFAGNSNSPPNSSMEDDQQFQAGALIDTNCLSPQSTVALQSTSTSSTTPDLHSLPQSIMTTATATTETNTTAPATTDRVGGECLNAAMSSATLSRSPVPSSSVVAVSPLASSSLHQQHNSPQTAMISPAANELLLQTCAADRLSGDRQFMAPTPSLQQQMQHLQPRMIKQEYMTDSNFASATTSSPPISSIPTTTTTATLIYQPPEHDQLNHLGHTQQQMFLGHTTLSISPPLDSCQSTPLLTPVAPAVMSAAPLLNYYEHDHSSSSIYANVVAFKKEEPSEVLLDTTEHTAPLSDESMIDAIDWWEAHTPQSDGSSVIL